VVFEANMRLNNVKHYKAVNPSLKILCISGAEDISITGGEKGLAATVNSLKSMGYKEVRNIVYPDMKHEVLNEKENIKVYNDVAEFYNS
jgi:S33 family lysophophospholipase